MADDHVKTISPSQCNDLIDFPRFTKLVVQDRYSIAQEVVQLLSMVPGNRYTIIEPARSQGIERGKNLVISEVGKGSTFFLTLPDNNEVSMK